MVRRLKIAQIITRLDPGGSAEVVIALCQRLDRERFDVTLITGPGTDAGEGPRELAERAGVTVAECPNLRREVAPLEDLRALLALVRYLRRIQPDVVHPHTSKAGALGRMAAAWAGGMPVVHSPHGHLFYGYYGAVGTGLVVLAERILAPLARRIAVLTDISRTEHLSRGVGSFEQYVTLYPGIDHRRFTYHEATRAAMRAELGLGPEQFVIGWAGRFTRVKGPDIFIEACGRVAGRLPDAFFLLAGDRELRTQTEQRAKSLGILDRCNFLGQRHDIPRILNACDAFALPSRNEGLGLAAGEAMACGTPVVAADVGGVREVLRGGHAGVVVPAQDVPALAEALAALALDERKCSRLRRAGLKRARDFDLGRMTDAFSGLYEELAQECFA